MNKLVQFLRNIFLFEFFFKSKDNRLETTVTDVKEEQEKAALELDKWLEDPINRNKIIQTARIFDQIMKGQWFDLKAVMNQTNYRSSSSALNILNTMKLAKCLIVEERGTKEVYRVSITGKNRIKMLEAQEKKLKRTLTEIEDELIELKKIHK